jgi:hypothetical protein
MKSCKSYVSGECRSFADRNRIAKIAGQNKRVGELMKEYRVMPKAHLMSHL